MGVIESPVTKAVKKAIEFLSEEQLPWGEFLTYSYLADSKGSYGLSPFATTFVLHALSFAPQTSEVRRMRSMGTRFILEHQEDPGIWRYYGKYVDLTPDVDDTACALVALIENGIKINPEITTYLLGFRDPQTLLFQTWMGGSPVLLENDTDSVVNANVLFLFGKLNRSTLIPEVISFLVSEAFRLPIQNSQIWYYSPYIFTYALSRAYADGKVRDLEQAKAPILRYLTLSQDEDGKWRNHLDTACALTTLLNFHYKGKEVEKAVQFLIKHQTKDGCWEEAMFNFPFASKEITTALCVEALSKYSKRHLSTK